MKRYIAVDIGASSGRLVHGFLNEGKLITEEIHRFENGFQKADNHDRWNIDELIREIFVGLEKAKEKGIDEAYLGIDTWAVDYVMIREDGEKVADPVSYRDKRTNNKIEELTSHLEKEYIYEKTGIQFLELNTLYQLYAEDRELLKIADKILFIPDYIGYVLTGEKTTEVTNASTTQMLNLSSALFDEELMDLVGVSKDVFAPFANPGKALGKVLDKWSDHYDLPAIEVISVASHDTASAVAGIPATSKDDWAYLSSGTWSLIGVESPVPVNTKAAYHHNFTNERGVYGTYRILKNIMGLWMVQEVRGAYLQDISFAEMARQADELDYFTSVVDVNDTRFTNPDDMIEEIQLACKETDQPVPETIGELTNCIYSSLAISYETELNNIEKITGKEIKHLHIVGGGSNLERLNEITAERTRTTVYAGPDESSAIGNLLVQMIAVEDIRDLQEGREILSRSFDIKEYKPKK
ncbi:rhamnulokinase [Alkalibacterium olivapovliticus]|uniref:Rhamnulokinase n=1 Tax=Alkalibacterium olivapovliticus TaxID=99907 RepID=A0A2T0VUF7_9LACT|nr:rhamnulokinase [Alkalibacterium olivapovliticus]